MTENLDVETTRVIRRHLLLTGGFIVATIIVVGVFGQLQGWTRWLVLGVTVVVLLLGQHWANHITDDQRRLVGRHKRRATIVSMAMAVLFPWMLYRPGLPAFVAFTLVAVVVMSVWVITAWRFGRA